MDINDVKIRLLTLAQSQGTSGAFTEELVKVFVETFKKNVEHVVTDQDMVELSPNQSMYTALIHLMSRAIFGEVLTRKNYTGENAVDILNENLQMLFHDLTASLNAMANEHLAAQEFEKDDKNEGPIN